MAKQIIAISPTNAGDHHAIEKVKWRDDQGVEAVVSRWDVVEEIKRHEQVFTLVDRAYADVEIEVERGVEYIWTEPTLSGRDNLLALPRF